MFLFEDEKPCKGNHKKKKQKYKEKTKNICLSVGNEDIIYTWADLWFPRMVHKS